jgi:ketosteroid isomerase-like protein
MSEENVEIVRQVYEAAAGRDAASIFALYDPDVELDATRLGVGDLGVYRLVWLPTREEALQAAGLSE